MLAPPRTRRIYSNTGWEVLFGHLASVTGIAVAHVPARTRSSIPSACGPPCVKGSPAKDLHGSVRDLITFVGELFEPTLIHPSTLAGRDGTRVR